MTSLSPHWNPALYSDKHAFVFEYGESLIQVLNPVMGERILDLGCGSGQLTAKIGQSGATVVGIDSSPDMIADAKRKFPDVSFHVMDAADFGFDEPFDAIFSNAVLHWVLKKEDAIRCIAANLKTEGRFVAEFGGKGNVQSIIARLRTSLSQRGFERNAATQLWYFPSIGEYATLLEKNGFRVILAQHYDRPTELADTQTGIKDWLEMFAGSFFQGLPAVEKEAIKEEVQSALQDSCLIDGKWYADYKRIRLIAVKE